jgi:hypothetical protein
MDGTAYGLLRCWGPTHDDDLKSGKWSQTLDHGLHAARTGSAGVVMRAYVFGYISVLF